MSDRGFVTVAAGLDNMNITSLPVTYTFHIRKTVESIHLY